MSNILIAVNQHHFHYPHHHHYQHHLNHLDHDQKQSDPTPQGGDSALSTAAKYVASSPPALEVPIKIFWHQGPRWIKLLKIFTLFNFSHRRYSLLPQSQGWTRLGIEKVYFLVSIRNYKDQINCSDSGLVSELIFIKLPFYHFFWGALYRDELQRPLRGAGLLCFASSPRIFFAPINIF